MNWKVIFVATAFAGLIGGISIGVTRASDKDQAALSKEFFPIMPWSARRLPNVGWHAIAVTHKNYLESMAECNFTVSCFVQPEDLALCEKLGLKAMMQQPPNWLPQKKNWKDLSDAEIDESIRQWVEKTGKSDMVLGYYIVDEPGASKFSVLGKAVAALRKYAPGKMPYINLYPGYATIGAPDSSQLEAASFNEYLERFVAHVDPSMLSYDNYKVNYSDNFQHVGEASIYFKDLLEVRRVAKKNGIPFWNTVCSNRIRPWTTIPSPANMMLQAYTTLAAGGRGLAWFTYYDYGYGYAPIDDSGNRTDTWQYLQMVNRQIKVLGPIMNTLESVGVYFTEPALAEGMPLLPGGIVQSVVSRSSIKGYSDSKPSLMIGEFKGEDGCDYVMVVNLSLEKSANFLLHTQKSYAVKEVVSAQDRSTSLIDETNGHTIVPGQGVLIKLSKVSSKAAEAEDYHATLP